MPKRIYKAYGSRASAILYRYITGLSSKAGTWILPANICPVVPATLFKAKKKIIFCDISLSSFCLNTDQALEILDKKTKEIEGIIFVRTYGGPVDPQNFFRYAKKKKESIFLVDDKCLCVPSFTYQESQADLTLYSSGYSKYVDLGWGGWGFGKSAPTGSDVSLNYSFQDQKEIEKAFCSALGAGRTYTYGDSHWLDTRLPAIKYEEYQATVLQRVNVIKEIKKTLNYIYDSYLNEFALPDGYHDWRFNIKCTNPETIINEAFKMGYFASRHYQSLVPSFGSGNVPNTVSLAGQVVNLFNDLRVNKDSVERLAKTIKKRIKKK